MASKEIIWHFTCVECRGFWSIAITNNWQPKNLYCTHCGKLQSFEVTDVKIEELEA